MFSILLDVFFGILHKPELSLCKMQVPVLSLGSSQEEQCIRQRWNPDVLLCLVHNESSVHSFMVYLIPIELKY